MSNPKTGLVATNSAVNFDSNLNVLKKLSAGFDEDTNKKRLAVLKNLSAAKLHLTKQTIKYYEILIYLCAFPSDMKCLDIAEKEQLRIAALFKKLKAGNNQKYINSGLPFTKYISCFSHDFVAWLLESPECTMSINRIENILFDLNEVLKITLLSLEKSETTAGLSNEDLFKVLLVNEKNKLPFLINELAKLNDKPFIKDHFYEGLGVYIELDPLSQKLSRAFNRIKVDTVYFHDSIFKKFDHLDLMKSLIPKPVILSADRKKEIVQVIKNSMVLTDRETDPVTFMDENSFRFFELERGISIAIYGIKAERQLPLESYVGYTLFKNGFPAAYGGAWVFGRRANFGINIFESFRGSESGYLMCQLLRVYKQVFEVDYFVIESYQIGYDNKEGIDTGVFWFYYKFGFRPIDKNVLRIADLEMKKRAKNLQYRSSKKTLLKFAESNMALNFGRNTPTGIYDIIKKVSRMIQVDYNGDRLNAQNDCINQFLKQTKTKVGNTFPEKQVLIEVSLWAQAMKIKDPDALNILVQIVKTKPVDLYKYQKLLLKYFNI